MDFKAAILRIFVCITLLFTTNALAVQNSPLPPQLIANIYQPPTPFKAIDKTFLVYEIYLTNYMKTPMTLSSLEVSGENNSFKFDSKALQNNLKTMDSNSEITPLSFQPGESKILYMWLQLNDTVPTQLLHRFALNGSIHNQNYQFDLSLRPLPIANTEPVIIEPPLRGKNWLAGNGPSNTSDHRRTGLILNGRPYYAQRYAIDFIQMGEDGKSYTGDITKNSSYHCYNQDVYAVADGTVVAVQDNIPQNTPNSGKLAVPVTEKNLPGNYVVLDIGDGKYVGYAHLIPGSLDVAVGDEVEKGDVIGKVGNSGNSTEPHLHFQVMDYSSFLQSFGLPYGFTHFMVRPIQIINSAQDASFQIQYLPGEGRSYSNQLVLENALMSFP